MENVGEARRLIASCVEHCSKLRLQSAIGHLAPAGTLNGLAQMIVAERDRKLERARPRRAAARTKAARRCAVG